MKKYINVNTEEIVEVTRYAQPYELPDLVLFKYIGFGLGDREYCMTLESFEEEFQVYKEHNLQNLTKEIQDVIGNYVRSPNTEFIRHKLQEVLKEYLVVSPDVIKTGVIVRKNEIKNRFDVSFSDKLELYLNPFRKNNK